MDPFGARDSSPGGQYLAIGWRRPAEDAVDFAGGRCARAASVGACNDDDAVDSWGDGCEWYTDNEWWCGDYDWEGFTAYNACCAC